MIEQFVRKVSLMIVFEVFLSSLLDNIPTVFIAVAGRSNGLGPVVAANTASPVINAPPSSEWSTNDIWSSLRMPSGKLS